MIPAPGDDSRSDALLLVVDGPTNELLHAAALPERSDPIAALRRFLQESGREHPRQILCRDPDLAERLRPLARTCWCLVRLVDRLPALEAAQRDRLRCPR